MKKIFLLALAQLMLATSCMDVTTELNPYTSGDEVEVTFKISPESATLATRGLVTYPAEGEFSKISDGTKADVLVYAVYDSEGKILAQYGCQENDTEEDLGDFNWTLGYGQCAKSVQKEHYPTQITLRLMRGQEYKIAFWTQSHECSAYVTTDLSNIEVKYSELQSPNNDELRDAFCKTETFTVTEPETREVILRRPLAQINVGVTGFDYEAASRAGGRVVESKIRIERAARFLNVITNKVDTDPERLQTIEYQYATIPAYLNMKADDGKQMIPEERFDLAQNDDNNYYNEQPVYKKYPFTNSAGEPIKNLPEENMLCVELDGDAGLNGYTDLNDWDVWHKKSAEEREALESTAENPYNTETFKYLSMCYILAPDYTDGTASYSTTLDKVDIYLKYHDEAMKEKVVTVDNVPVQRNYRTNIFGEMLTADVNLRIDVDPIYAGDYNWPDWVQIAEGVSYDTELDEIHISNGLGLQWLADMVNGNISDPTLENPDDLTAQRRKAMILKATKNLTWPEATGDNGVIVKNRFTFHDVTVKLMNDVDFAIAENITGLKSAWTPIGFGDFHGNMAQVSGGQSSAYNVYFDGTFDGGNHTIRNLKTIIEDEANTSSVGLFGTLGWNAIVKNVRLKDIKFHGHYRTGAIVGCAYGKEPMIDNCYVDGGEIIVTPAKLGDDYYDDANNVGGIVGQYDAHGDITNCNVRNLTIRAYRALGGLVGSVSQEGSYNGRGYAMFKNNTISDVTLIVDQFQPYESSPYGWSVKDAFIDVVCGRPYSSQAENNVSNNVTIITFDLKAPKTDTEGWGIGSPDHDNKYRYTEIGNAPMGIFPLLSNDYCDYIKFTSSIVGVASADKNGNRLYDNDGIAQGGKVGLYVDGLYLDGGGEQNMAGRYVLTATDVSGNDDCTVYITGENTALKDLVVRGDQFAYTGICLAPAEGGKVTIENVSVYDVYQTLAGSGNGATLSVTGSNLRGWTNYGTGWNEVTFTSTIFESGAVTDIDAQNENKLSVKNATTFTDCVFKAPYTIEISAKADFSGCQIEANGKYADLPVSSQSTGTITVSIDAQGNPVVE